jgi:hypothetical protein
VSGIEESVLSDRLRAWSKLLAVHLYSDANEGSLVYLDMEEELFNRFAELDGLGFEPSRSHLLESVTSVLGLSGDANVYSYFLEETKKWDLLAGDNSPPPALPLLAVLVLGAESMEGDKKFSANNYYDRLCETLGLAPQFKKILEKDYSKRKFNGEIVAEYLWESLNRWLEKWEGLRGLPTAFAAGSRFVGVPRSQALIRNQDRKSLYSLFSEEGFHPRMSLAANEMRQIIDEWINQEPCPAQSLKYVWDKDKETIAEIACQELSTWDGVEISETGDSVSRTRPLRLLLYNQRSPLEGYDLSLAGRGGMHDGKQEIATFLDQQNNEVDMLRDANGVLELSQSLEYDTAGLLRHILLTSKETSEQLERLWRSVIPFHKDNDLGCFAEVPELVLTKKSKVICRENFSGQVQRLLELTALPNFQIKRIEGFPPEWVIFDDVQVVAAISEEALAEEFPSEYERSDLICLLPKSAFAFALDGGFKIPEQPSQWSSLFPPDVSVSAGNEASFQLELKSQFLNGGGDTTIVAEEFLKPIAIWSLPALEKKLAEGSYYLSLRGNSEGIKFEKKLLFRVRSAEYVKPRKKDSTAKLSYSVGQLEQSVVSAALLEGETEAPVVRGALIAFDGDKKTEPPQMTFVPRWLSPEKNFDHRRSSIDAVSVLKQIGSTIDPVCAEPGKNHYWVSTKTTEETDRERREGIKPVGGESWICRYCELEQKTSQWQYGSRSKKRAAKQKSQQKTSSPLFNVKVLPIVASETPTTEMLADIALDVLSYLNEGTRHTLKEVISQVELSSSAIDAHLRGLIALGHIEASFDLKTMKLSRWEIGPTVLVGLPSGNFTLSGFRNKSMLEKLEELVDEFGGEVNKFEQKTEDGFSPPSVLEISNISLEEMELIIDDLPKVFGCTVVPDAARGLAELLPSLSEILPSLNRVPLSGAKNIQQWDSKIAKWSPTQDCFGPGYFKLTHFTTRYMMRTNQDVAENRMSVLNARLLKHIAALQNNDPLIGYDSEKESLYVPSGAELPGLYGRSATLASGSLPRFENGFLVYKRVPADLAATLKRKLEN